MIKETKFEDIPADLRGAYSETTLFAMDSVREFLESDMTCCEVVGWPEGEVTPLNSLKYTNALRYQIKRLPSGSEPICATARGGRIFLLKK